LPQDVIDRQLGLFESVDIKQSRTSFDMLPDASANRSSHE